MREPLTEAEKEYIYRRKMSGETLKNIARELECSFETARKGWRQKRDGQATKPRGRPASGVLSTYPAEVRQTAIELKRAHPSQGPKRILLDLTREFDGQVDQLPSASRLAELFRQECPEAVKAYAQPAYASEPPLKPTRVHQLWQVDGKESVPYGDGEVATIQNIREPYIGMMLASQAFQTTTEKHCRKLTLIEVQDTFRGAFSKWGLPEMVQTDNETVYVGPPERYFPSLFTLWLVGLKIAHQPGRKGRPTDQGSVERGHRTQGNWSWHDETFETLAALQASLDLNLHLYNTQYPSQAGRCYGQPPLAAFPQATHSGRPFDPAAEWELFDLKRVDAFLADRSWNRKVDDNGVVRIAGFRYYIQRKLAQQPISIIFLPESRHFRFQLHDGAFICNKPAQGLDQADIIGRIPSDDAWPTLREPFQLPLPF